MNPPHPCGRWDDYMTTVTYAVGSKAAGSTTPGGSQVLYRRPPFAGRASQMNAFVCRARPNEVSQGPLPDNIL